VPFDSPAQSLAVLLPSLVLALLTHLLNPEGAPRGADTLEAHYEHVRSRALPLAGLFLVLCAASDALLPGVLEAPPPVFFLVQGASLAALGTTSNKVVHLTVLGLNTLAAAAVFVLSRT
jgi:hypothetical protein